MYTIGELKRMENKGNIRDGFGVRNIIPAKVFMTPGITGWGLQ